MAIIKGAINPVISGTTTFPELDNIQVTAPNRHSVRPSLVLDFANSKTLDPRITFGRGSNATYYDGSTALAEQNLLAYSQSFSYSLWVNLGEAGVTTNYATAPDGTFTAAKLTPTTANAIHRIYTGTIGGTTNGPVTYSVYAKADGYSQLGMFVNGPDKGVLFDLSAGTASDSAYSPYTGATYSITSVGSGWYRCVMTANTSSTITNVQLQIMSGGTGTFTGNSSNGIAIWGVQFENRPFASPYTVTTTTPVVNHITALKVAGGGVARFDLDPVTKESKGLMCEEARTNIIQYSGSQDISPWSTGSGATLTKSFVLPSGGNAYKLTETTASATSHLLLQGISVTAGTWVSSIYAKAGEITTIALGFSNYSTWTGANGTEAKFNLSNGTWAWSDPAKAGTDAGIIPVGNGWYRCYIVGTTATTQSTNQVIYLVKGGLTTYNGDGWSGAYVYGAQVEAGYFPSSYIPTWSASATRAADVAEITGTNFSNFFNNTTGTFYFEGSVNGSPNTNQSMQGAFAATRDTGNGNVIDLRAQQTGYGSMAVLYGYGGTQAQISNSITATARTNMKFGIAYAPNDAVVYKDGTQIGSDTSVVVPSGLTKLEIGKGDNNSDKSLNGYIRKLSYYPVRLSNAEIISLTAA